MCVGFVRRPRLPVSCVCVCGLVCIVSFLGACGGGGSPATSNGVTPTSPFDAPFDAPSEVRIDFPNDNVGGGITPNEVDGNSGAVPLGIGTPDWAGFLGTPTPGTIDDPAHYETDEYFYSGYTSFPLDETRFSSAYARGWTGRGSVLTIADTGVDVDHPDLAANIGYVRDFSGTGMNDNNGHGSHVAGIAAAVKNGRAIHGAAFDATLAIGKVTNNSSYSFTTARAVAAWGRDLNSVAINVSAAYSRNNFLEQYLVPVGTGDYYLDYAPYQADGYYYARQEAVAWRAALGPNQVLVKAAGNDGTSYSAGMNQLATATDDNGNLILNGQMLVVGNWDADYGVMIGNAAGNVCVTWRSGRCHDAAKIGDFFLLAPGVDVFSTYYNGGYATLTGTSMAAPMVTAALGVLHQMWPHMTGRNLVQLALQTADTNIAGYAPHIHGQGILDMERATQPVGATGLPVNGRTAGGVVTPAATIRMAGTNPTAAAALGAVMVLDAFERDFYIDLTGAVEAADLRRGSVAAAGGVFNGYAPYFDPDHHASYKMALAPRLTLETGLGSATGEVLGMQMQGTLGTIARSTTSYGLLEYGTMVGPVAVAGQIGVGVSHLEFDQSHSLLRRANMMTSSSWAITGSRAVPTGRVGVGVSQPVAIESARFHYEVPVGRTPAGQVLYADHPVDFKPTKRETDLAVFYAGAPGPLGGAVTISTEWRINRAHMRGSDSVELAAEWRLRL